MDQLLVIAFPVASMDDYDAVIALENRLYDALPSDLAAVDGHDTGGGLMQIFIWCDDAAATFEASRAIVGIGPDVRAGWRHGDGEDYVALWPPGLGHFALS